MRKPMGPPRGQTRRRVLATGIPALAVAMLPRIAWADAAEAFRGQTITWVVPFKPGGGFDQMSRLLAPYFEAETGARVDVLNVPGSGGMKGAVEVFRSPADGRHMGLMSGAALVGNKLAEEPGAAYEIAQFGFLARLTAEPRVLIVRKDFAPAGFAEMMAAGAPVVIASTGKGGSSYVDTVVAGRAFGLNQKIVAGFNGTADMRLALLRGDCDAMWASMGSTVAGISSGDFVPVLHTDRVGAGVLEGVPSVFDFTAGIDADARSLVDAWAALSEVGRPIVVPPGVPAKRVAFLRAALARAIADPAFVAQMETAGRGVNYAPGEEVAAIAERASRVSGTARETLVAIIRGGS